MNFETVGIIVAIIGTIYSIIRFNNIEKKTQGENNYKLTCISKEIETLKSRQEKFETKTERELKEQEKKTQDMLNKIEKSISRINDVQTEKLDEMKMDIIMSLKEIILKFK